MSEIPSHKKGKDNTADLTNLVRRKSNDLFGFDAEFQRDTRNVRHKGKHGYSSKEKIRIEYIKEKKTWQKEDQSKSALQRFHYNISNK
jgi:hypothetical protein